MRLTKRSVESIEPDPGRELFVWDAELPGFGVRVYPSGRRAFLIQYRAGRRTRRLDLGTFGKVTADEARKAAKAAFGEIARGRDPLGRAEGEAHGCHGG